MYKKNRCPFQRKRSFLNPDYSLNDLVDEIKVPRHLLSSSSIKNMALVLENFSIVKGLSMLWKISINLNGKISRLRLEMNLALEIGLLL
jgi:hypothetical protein